MYALIAESATQRRAKKLFKTREEADAHYSQVLAHFHRMEVDTQDNAHITVVPGDDECSVTVDGTTTRYFVQEVE